ncbi:MAG: helix-turn-helix transcriptional regulator [Atopobiaceae bacterium]|nr:helix-turn-helix transcriptional regulator [Atopobiaceae bacterium]
MPIVLHIDDLARSRGCTVQEMADAIGISRVNMSKLKNGNVRALRFSTLESICEFFDCQPGDVIEYVKEE